MALDAALQSKVESLWSKLWTGGLSNPMDAIEQFSYLLFLKRLDETESRAQSAAERRGKVYTSRAPEEMRWRYWSQLPAAKAIEHVRGKVFPWFKEMGAQESSFAEYMKTAEFKINSGSLLITACKEIDEMRISSYEQDVQGDLYEYLLKKLSIAGRNGQFFTPRHIIRMMVKMVDPKPDDRIGDLAAGTAGFLVHAYQHILEKGTPKETIEYNGDGVPHHLTGELLSQKERTFLQTKALRGYDNDSGMTILRIGSMNLMLHGIEAPRFFYADTLSKGFDAERSFDVILMNPPFKGAVNADDINDNLPHNTTKSELLFLHLILRSLDMGGRCAVIVPDGVLFGSSRAHVEARRKIIEENRLDGVISMPSGVFKPYAGVSTAVLLFTRGGETKDTPAPGGGAGVWFYDMEHDGFSLDDKRTPVSENDIPDILECWRKRRDRKFVESREQRIRELRKALEPLKVERLRLHEEINRLRFESVLDGGPKTEDGGLETGDGDSFAKQLAEAEKRLAKVEGEIGGPQSELDRLTRQFWVTKEQVKANKYDLSASRYRQVDADAEYHEKPSVTLERLSRLERVMLDEIQELGKLVNG